MINKRKVAQTVTMQNPELVSHVILFRITSPGGMFYHLLLHLCSLGDHAIKE
jgi:hypothetical protein